MYIVYKVHHQMSPRNHTNCGYKISKHFCEEQYDENNWPRDFISVLGEKLCLSPWAMYCDLSDNIITI